MSEITQLGQRINELEKEVKALATQLEKVREQLETTEKRKKGAARIAKLPKSKGKRESLFHQDS